MRDAVGAGAVRSMRDAQRFVVQHYVHDLLGTPSLSQTTSLPPA